MLLLGLPAKDWQFPGSLSQNTHKFSKDPKSQQIFPLLQGRPEDLSNNHAISKWMALYDSLLQQSLGELHVWLSNLGFLFATKRVVSLKSKGRRAEHQRQDVHKTKLYTAPYWHQDPARLWVCVNLQP